MARYQDSPQQSFSAQFDIKEYGKDPHCCPSSVPESSPLSNLLTQSWRRLFIQFGFIDQLYNPINSTFSPSPLVSPVLPSFEVTLEPSEKFFYIDGNEDLKIHINARWVSL